MFEKFERQLSEKEIRHLKRQLNGIKSKTNRSYTKIIITQSAIGFGMAGLICTLGYYAGSGNPAPLWFYFLILFGAGGAWTILFSISEINKLNKLERYCKLITDSIKHGKARVKQVRSERMIALEEYEDEGAGYFFEVEVGKILFLYGQEYYSSPKFPNTDFSLIDLVDSNGTVVDSIIEKNGNKLMPYKTISANEKLKMHIPSDETLIECKIDELEAYLLGNN